MKTLKKTLCLVLAVVMVVGVLILPASAATYEDDAEITHKEAVEVLTGLKVLSGDADGFRPTDTLNRAEAAAVISRMLQTCAVADKFSSTNTGFTDCEASNVSWAKRYIAYCVNQGIIAGTEKGFEPARDVTGHEFAKMLLCAVGFDAAESGFYGDQWDVNVELIARKVGLVDNLAAGFDFTAPVSRDDVAQMTFDAMQYHTTGTATGRYKIVKLSGATVTGDGLTILNSLNGKEFASQTEALLTLNAALENVTTKPVLGTDYRLDPVTTNTNSILNTTYNGYSSASKPDAFQRPARVWSDPYNINKKVTITQEPIAKFTDTVSSKTLYITLGRDDEADVELYVDGNVDSTSMPKIASSGADAAKTVGKRGAEVYVYGTTDPDTFKVCVINTYVGTIATHVAAEKDANGNITVKEKVTVDKLSTGISALDSDGFETTAFTDADQVAHTTVYFTATTTDNSTYKLRSVVAAPSFTGTMTSYNTGTNSYLIGGTTYALNKNTPEITSASGVPSTFYTDGQGLIIRAVALVPQQNHAVLTHFALVAPQTSGAIGAEAAKYLQAELVMFDGSVKIVTVGTIEVNSTKYAATAVTGTTLLSDAATIQTDVEQKVVTYTSDSDDVYAITVPTQDVTKTSATIKATSKFDDEHIANSQTKFIIRTGATQAQYAYSLVTGYANLPTGLTADSITVTGVLDSDIATFVYLSGTVDTSSSGNNRVVFVTGAPTHYLADGINPYYEYPVIENGVAGTIKVKDASTVTNRADLNNGDAADKFWTITTIDSATGYVTGITKTNDGDTAKYVTTITGAAANDVIKLEEGQYKDYNANTVAYLVSNGAVSKVDITTLRVGKVVYVTYVQGATGDTNVIATITAID